MRRLLRVLVWVAVLAALAAAGGAALLWYRYTEDGPLASAKTIVIGRGSNIDEIAIQLMEAGIVSSIYPFAVMTRIDGLGRGLKPGEYAFAARISPRGAAELLASGKTVVRKITEQQAELGTNYLLAYMFFGTLSFETALRSMELFRSEVMPKIAHL